LSNFFVEKDGILAFYYPGKTNMKSSFPKIIIHPLTPRESASGLNIHYSVYRNPFGEILIASTHKGICFMEFTDSTKEAITHLSKCFPNAKLEHQVHEVHEKASMMLSDNPNSKDLFHLHLKGTDFQLRVWAALTKIPCGQLVTYGMIAASLDQPSASRAVGNAVAHNPVAYLIPCHRVVPASGKIGNFKWGTERKSKLILWELKNNSE
jgi:AraC family transcriptional regulator, regulatory protein of adaptative response / methylated-DNA-[protein]-cysteine methyltransferase